jgi:very-short-patch-repair endonuclease
MEYAPSKAELRLIEALCRRGLVFSTQYEVYGFKDQSRPYKLDIAFPDVMLAVEVEGPYHANPDSHKHDITRTKLIEDRGWTIRRVHSDECSFERVIFTAINIQCRYMRLKTKSEELELHKQRIGIELREKIEADMREKEENSIRPLNPHEKESLLYRCADCYRPITHRGRCWPCNTKNKKRTAVHKIESFFKKRTQ